ncbi:hypothetical protein LMJ53_08125 [Rheinheimera sp. UJ51]|uniref:hypothetical protein n=1 Tax=Rheinheimera sp. UJ51 TaxID=2892446 RepID=UPI001E5F1FF1|nr:hypothetical protein [Rheinheimera sp. UJ51]MCC5451691.1 hypothetical protein [Rheinheimera sp. UJ51]
MINYQEKSNTVTEYVIRKLVNSFLPGELISGPFKNEQEANKALSGQADMAVFKETWII